MTGSVTYLDARAMSEAQFEREREQIRETYGDSSVEAAALRDQKLAELFHRSGWTQERLAAKEGCDQKTVSRRLLFGRFLDFRPDGPNPRNLTERTFRRFWQEPSGTNERQRFAEVAKLIEENTRVRTSGMTPASPGLTRSSNGNAAQSSGWAAHSWMAAMTDHAHNDRQLFLHGQRTHEFKLARAIQWLRERNLYRGDLRCEHRYKPALPMLGPEAYR